VRAGLIFLVLSLSKYEDFKTPGARPNKEISVERRRGHGAPPVLLADTEL
jgi:hypothetical protein